jgi:hypothetical protein
MARDHFSRLIDEEFRCLSVALADAATWSAARDAFESAGDHAGSLEIPELLG